MTKNETHNVIPRLLKAANQEREEAYDRVLKAKQDLEAAQKAFNDASWEMQMLVSKIGILIDQLEGND